MKISLLGKATYFGFQSMWTQASSIVIISQLGDRPLPQWYCTWRSPWISYSVGMNYNGYTDFSWAVIVYRLRLCIFLGQCILSEISTESQKMMS